MLSIPETPTEIKGLAYRASESRGRATPGCSSALSASHSQVTLQRGYHPATPLRRGKRRCNITPYLPGRVIGGLVSRPELGYDPRWGVARNELTRAGAGHHGQRGCTHDDV